MTRRNCLISLLAALMVGSAWSKPSPKPSLGRSFETFEFGCYLSTAVIGRAKGANFSRFDEQSKDLAKILKVNIPAYPKLKQDPEGDLALAVGYLVSDCKKLAKAFSSSERTAFEIGLKIHILRVVYIDGKDGGLADGLTVRLRVLGMPGDACRGLRKSVAAKAENPEIQRELTDIYEKVRAFLKPKS